MEYYLHGIIFLDTKGYLQFAPSYNPNWFHSCTRMFGKSEIDNTQAENEVLTLVIYIIQEQHCPD